MTATLPLDLDRIAVGAARHQAILHPAGGGQFAGEPPAGQHQHDGDDEADQGGTAARPVR